VDQEILEGLFPKAVSLIEIDFFHELSPFEQVLLNVSLL
jgi:hypothetical protein